MQGSVGRAHVWGAWLLVASGLLASCASQTTQRTIIDPPPKDAPIEDEETTAARNFGSILSQIVNAYRSEDGKSCNARENPVSVQLVSPDGRCAGNEAATTCASVDGCLVVGGAIQCDLAFVRRLLGHGQATYYYMHSSAVEFIRRDMASDLVYQQLLTQEYMRAAAAQDYAKGLSGLLQTMKSYTQTYVSSTAEAMLFFNIWFWLGHEVGHVEQSSCSGNDSAAMTPRLTSIQKHYESLVCQSMPSTELAADLRGVALAVDLSEPSPERTEGIASEGYWSEDEELRGLSNLARRPHVMMLASLRNALEYEAIVRWLGKGDVSRLAGEPAGSKAVAKKYYDDALLARAGVRSASKHLPVAVRAAIATALILPRARTELEGMTQFDMLGARLDGIILGELVSASMSGCKKDEASALASSRAFLKDLYGSDAKWLDAKD